MTPPVHPAPGEMERGMAKESIMTSEGLKRLEDELEELKTVKRKEIAEKINSTV